MEKIKEDHTTTLNQSKSSLTPPQCCHFSIHSDSHLEYALGLGFLLVRRAYAVSSGLVDSFKSLAKARHNQVLILGWLPMCSSRYTRTGYILRDEASYMDVLVCISL